MDKRTHSSLEISNFSCITEPTDRPTDKIVSVDGLKRVIEPIFAPWPGAQMGPLRQLKLATDTSCQNAPMSVDIKSIFLELFSKRCILRRPFTLCVSWLPQLLLYTFCQSRSMVAGDGKTSQELRMLSSVTINCQITKIVMNSGSQLSEL